MALATPTTVINSAPTNTGATLIHCGKPMGVATLVESSSNSQDENANPAAVPATSQPPTWWAACCQAAGSSARKKSTCTCCLRASTVAPPRNTMVTIRPRATSSAQSTGWCTKYRRITEMNTTRTSTASTTPHKRSMKVHSVASNWPLVVSVPKPHVPALTVGLTNAEPATAGPAASCGPSAMRSSCPASLLSDSFMFQFSVHGPEAD